MTDREKTIKGLKYCKEYFSCCDKCPYWYSGTQCVTNLANDAFDLLKEQPDIVRCGDCKYYNNGFCYNPNTFDEKTCGNTVPDWFCADGGRK